MSTAERNRQLEILKILFVEDDPENAELFVNCFDEEYSILCAASGEEALEIFKREEDIAMVLSDQGMPGMSGVDLLSHVYARKPETIRIIITGFVDISNAIDAINKGHIYQFILKPWDIVQMRIILDQASNTWLLQRENRELQEQVVAQNKLLTRTNEQLQASEKDLRSLSTALFTAQEDEQKRIAMELHDELGQALAAFKLQLSIMENDLGSGDECLRIQVCGWIDRFREDIKQIIENVRRLSKNLSPVIIDDLGLDAAIENFVSGFVRTHAISCSFKPTPLSVITSADGQRIVYRLIQETLNNIGKHSGASHFDFSIRVEDGQIRLQMGDNGNGFDFQEVASRSSEDKGIGLTAMAERVKMLGGTMVISSEPSQGTEISFIIPVDSDLISGSQENGHGTS